jgi:glycosyltransferase involved in cell wall biosynthesis
MRVIILMSTFNGERFIEEQVRSILDQLPADGLLMVRDDGSSDGTVARIQAFGDARIHISTGPNIGFAQSFLTLLSQTPSNADMVMFSDQDDVWLPEKIERAWQHLQPQGNRPALYCSAQMLVDESLCTLHATPPWPHPPSFTNALAENIVTGCTAAINQSALQLLQQAGVPEGVQFHDWWLYLVVSAFGTVVVDNQPTVLYRQHSGNLIGHGVGWWGRQLQMAKFLFKYDWVGILLGQISELKHHYDLQLNSVQHRLLANYFQIIGVSSKPRWRIIFSFKRWRQKLIHEPLFRILIVIWIVSKIFDKIIQSSVKR